MLGELVFVNISSKWKVNTINTFGLNFKSAESPQ